jgi:AcrR family transcriptional regulator
MPTPTLRSHDRIFLAARAIFERDGLPGLSIRKIAADVGLTPMAIYRHFADKDALIDALMLDGFAAWEATVAAIVEPQSMAWLDQVFEAYLDFALTQPHRFDAAFILPARGARQYPGDFAGGRSPVVAQIFERIDQAKAEGWLSDAPTLEIALAFSALAQGLVSMQRANRFSNEAAFRRLYRLSFGHAVAAFAPDARAQKRNKTA